MGCCGAYSGCTRSIGADFAALALDLTPSDQIKLISIDGIKRGPPFLLMKGLMDRGLPLEFVQNELLQEVLDGGHRVLVFSQFVEMLQILKRQLEEQKIDFCYLDGSTTDRARVVQEFQSKPIPVFLISLKAGGVGLNLAAADTVIHFDPWWNPAVEAQATDRAHRIGQTRIVTSYKLITRGTVEEKILRLQNQKRELIASTLAGEEQMAGSLTWEELQGLFS